MNNYAPLRLGKVFAGAARGVGVTALSIAFAVVAIGLAIAQSDALSSQEAKAEITRLSAVYDAAIKAKDAKALARLFDDAGTFIDQDGAVLNKRGAIASFTKVPGTCLSSKSSIRSIRVLGGIVIETGTWTAVYRDKGKRTRMRNRYTDVWIRKDDSWVLTAEHASAVKGSK